MGENINSAYGCDGVYIIFRANFIIWIRFQAYKTGLFGKFVTYQLNVDHKPKNLIFVADDRCHICTLAWNNERIVLSLLSCLPQEDVVNLPSYVSS